jgi:hypothetical protein
MHQECFRPCGPAELELVRQSGFRRWPPRLLGQPFFYPVTNLEYAEEITVKWNVPADGAGFVTRFWVRREFLDCYPVQTVGGERHTEWWIPAEDLDELNDHLMGLIEVVASYP